MGLLECVYYTSENPLADYVPQKGSQEVPLTQEGRNALVRGQLTHRSSMIGFCRLTLTVGNVQSCRTGLSGNKGGC